jgi:hypothetical protein
MQYARPSPPPRVHGGARLALAGLLTVALIVTAAPQAFAQEADLDLKLLFGFNKDPKVGKPGEAELRPNAAQEVFVFVENKTGEDQEATVELMSGEAVQLSSSPKMKFKKKEKDEDPPTLVVWDTAPAVKTALPSDIWYRIKNKDGKVVKNSRKTLQVARPYTYLTSTATYVPGSEKAKNHFELTVKPNKTGAPVGGPPIKVELDISPANIDKLVPGQAKSGRYSGFLVLDAVNAFLTLEAKGLLFADSAVTPEGTIYATVDGFKRAIIADTTFGKTGGEGKVDIRDAARMSLPLPKYSVPTTLKLPVFADGNIDWSDRVLIQVLAAKKKEGDEEKKFWATVKEFKGPRQVKHNFVAGGDGGLAFAPDVADWIAELDFSGVFDATEVRLMVLPEGKTADTDAKPLYNGATRKTSGKEVIQGITFDATPPEVLEYVAAPEAAYRGRVLAVYVDAADKESGITEVYFYLGKPAEGGKLAPGVEKVPGERVPGTEFWLARFPIPADAKGTFQVNVVAVNGVGLASTKPLILPITDPPPEAAAVSGRVFEMDNPIDNLPVLLLSSEGVELQLERTAGGGKYAFKGLQPGTYGVFARREQSRYRKLRTLVIKGREQVTDFDLLLEPPPAVLKERKKKLGSISGVVKEGPRPQAGLKVQLVDPVTRREIKSTTTNAGGGYKFSDLPKRSYVVFVAKSASTTKAQAAVDLDTGEDKTGVDLKLFR